MRDATRPRGSECSREPTPEPIPEKESELRRVEGHLLGNADGKQRQRSPEEYRAAGPGGDQQQPPAYRRMPECQGRQAIKQRYPQLGQRRVNPERRQTSAAREQHRRVQKKHSEMCGNDDGEDDQRENDERDARLRKYGGQVGDRQRSPEQDAPVAALTVQSVETVEPAGEQPREDEQNRGDRIGLFDWGWIVGEVECQRGTRAARRMNDVDGESDQNHGGNHERREVEETVLPQFAPQGPVER